MQDDIVTFTISLNKKKIFKTFYILLGCIFIVFALYFCNNLIKQGIATHNQKVLSEYTYSLSNSNVYCNYKYIRKINTKCVYWVENGKCIHSSDKCPSLKSSYKINGTDIPTAIHNGKQEYCHICVG